MGYFAGTSYEIVLVNERDDSQTYLVAYSKRKSGQGLYSVMEEFYDWEDLGSEDIKLVYPDQTRKTISRFANLVGYAGVCVEYEWCDTPFKSVVREMVKLNK